MKKLFRLFISSTFSDFKHERELLQRDIFPRLSAYCESVGYQFQPIDLRWGVQTEAQLDQKTLEICLDQVRACKHFPHPNFLIMVGHRYGWVPLPYAIERREFLRIRRHLFNRERARQKTSDHLATAIDAHDDGGIGLLNRWYRLDRNHLCETDSGDSAAYVLVPRTGEYEFPDAWVKVEDRLRGMLQAAATSLRLTGRARDKYFLSATEHEVIEGIFDYRIDDRRDGRPGAPGDSEYVYAFIRGHGESSLDSSVRNFRQSLRNAIPAENIFESAEIPGYCDLFAESLFGFLKRCVDNHLARVGDIPVLDQETDEQEAYRRQKVANFLGREDILVQVDAYLAGGGDHSDEPLVFHGHSGIGKSSLLAKVVERIQRSGQRVVFRFIGATTDSSSSRSLLTSICQECGQLQDPRINFEDQGEPFTEFSCRVSRFLGALQSPLVLVIDALDQLANCDELLWLPEPLPPSLKIILSVLNDQNYREDSRYCRLLERRYRNLHEIPGLSDVGQLLDELLLVRRRTLQTSQRNYVLRQYAKTCSPLFLKVVLEEIVNWRSYEGRKFIGSNQREAIAAFIRSLSTVYHHSPEFVDRVFGYILASDEGIAEGELLSIFSSNLTLLQRLAPETFHVNATRKLPLAIWARLHFQLQNFLVTKYSDGYGLLSFFHREFRDATRAVVPLRLIHEELIGQLEHIVTEIQARPFGVTRWGKLLALASALYSMQNDDKLEQVFVKFIAGLRNRAWIGEYVCFVEGRGDFYNQHNQMTRALIYNKHLAAVVDILYRREGSPWLLLRIGSLIGLAGTYFNLNRLNEASALEAQAIEILGSTRDEGNSRVKLLVQTLLNHSATLEKLGMPADSLRCKEQAYQALPRQDDVPEFDDVRLKCLIELSYHHAEHLGNKTRALELSQQALALARRLKDENAAKYIKYYVAILVNTAIWIDDLDTAIDYEQRALAIVEPLLKQNRALWIIHDATCRNNLAFSYEAKGRYQEAETIFSEVLEDVRSRYEEDKSRWTRAYAKSLTNLAQFHLNRRRMELATAHFTLAFEAVAIKYQADPKNWADQYVKKTMNLAAACYTAGEFRKCAQLENTSLAVIEPLRATEPGKWDEAYAFILDHAIRTRQQLKQIRPLRTLRRKAEDLNCRFTNWNSFYRKNPIVISTVFLNR